ncbi:hypothetical protein HY639_00075 [Candidatus Woesearchaeota archaeon]|nr:hypothetical protein [Candidatus Woesearchaeota archaeon]
MKKLFVVAVVKRFCLYLGDVRPKDGFDLVGIMELGGVDACHKATLLQAIKDAEAAFSIEYPSFAPDYETRFASFYERNVKEHYGAYGELKGPLTSYFLPHGSCKVGEVFDAVPQDALPLTKWMKKG